VDPECVDMSTQASLIGDLEGAIQNGSDEKRLRTLRRITDLFLTSSDRLSEEQVAVFDGVIGRLIRRVEDRALVELSERLATAENGPIDVIRQLANDDKIAVAGPVLSQSARLATSDLVDIANSKSQEHLLAISSRRHLEEALTSVLVQRGNTAVLHKLSSNPGARFSEDGFVALLHKSGTEESLLEAIGLRADLPAALLREVLMKAGKVLRSHLLSVASPALRNAMQDILDRLTTEASEQVASQRTAARRAIHELNAHGHLNETALMKFATCGERDEVIASLEVMTVSQFETIARIFESHALEAVLIPCAAAGLTWPTTHAILMMNHPGISESDMANLEGAFANLSMRTAQRTLRFWQVRSTLTADAPPTVAGWSGKVAARK
jgi:uncharacterized protein (DUF2336 family)